MFLQSLCHHTRLTLTPAPHLHSYLLSVIVTACQCPPFHAVRYPFIQELNNFEIRKGRLIGVCHSVDNCRLFVGGIPKTKYKAEIIEEMRKVTDGVVDVIVYPSATGGWMTYIAAFYDGAFIFQKC